MEKPILTLGNLSAQIEDALITQGFQADVIFNTRQSATLIIVSPLDRTKIAHCMITLSDLPPVPEENG